MVSDPRPSAKHSLLLLFFIVACVLSIAPALPAAPAAAPASWSREDAAHLLRRAAFGGTPRQIDRLHAMGRDAAVEYLLTGQPPGGTEPAFAPVTLEDFKPSEDAVADRREALKDLTPAERQALIKARGQAEAGQPPPELTPELRRKLQQAKRTAQMNGRQDIQRLRAWWVDRMLRTDRPLEEKMTLFWHGLFTSGVREVKVPLFMVNQNALLHRHALGNYRKLTHAIVHDPAMLKYLDNDRNVVGKPNENLGRELLELFTMGEGSGYTEKDIAEVARALTGLAPTPGGVALVRPKGHDRGEKTIFGKAGNFGPDDVMDLIFDRPEPSRHLARRLWEFFAYPEPSDEELKPVADTLKRSGYELKPALRALFTSPAFYGEKARFALIKSPAELAVSTMRLLERRAEEMDVRAIERSLRAMDQELLQPPNVRGWVGGDNWITAATLYTRYNIATAMVNGGLPAAVMGRMQKDGKPQAGAKPPGEKPQDAKPQDAKPQAAEPDPRKLRHKMLERRREADGKTGGAGIEPAKLFASLGESPPAAQLVDAAVERFLQRGLHAGKRQALVEVLADAPIRWGDADSDQRVRQMLGLLLSTPEYQVQ